MLWLYLAAAGSGALFGLLRLRVLAVVAGSIVLVAMTAALAGLGHWPLLEAVVTVFLLQVTLQFSYLAALILSGATRVASRDASNAWTRRM